MAEAKRAAESKPKSAAECQREYDQAQAECTAFAHEIPGIKRQITDEVRRRMGDPEKKLGDMIVVKGQKYREWQTALADEKPQRDKAAQLQAQKAAQALVKDKAAQVAARLLETQQNLARRLRGAVQRRGVPA